MGSKHRKTLAAIFQNPVLSSIKWTEIEKMLISYGATITMGKGSRKRITFDGNLTATFHRSHPRKEADRGTVKSMRNFLTKAGIKP